MGARKPRVGWRNRNYLAGLSEATEEKGLVARVSCGRRLKYRKFKHRSTPPPDPPVRAAPHHRHWIYISSTASSASPLFFHLARPSLPPSSTPSPEAARDPPRFSASGRQASQPPIHGSLPRHDCSPLRVCWLVDRSTRFSSRIDKTILRRSMDGSFFFSSFFFRSVESDIGGREEEREIDIWRGYSPIEVITSLNDNSIAVVGPWRRGTNEHTRGAINRDSLSRG